MSQQRIKFRGMFIPIDQIDQYEQLYGGKFVFDERLASILERITQKRFSETKRIPGVLRLPQIDPFTYFIPIRVEGEIMNMNLKGIETNSFVFIAVKRIM